MSKKFDCDMINDLLPLYMDNLTSEKTNKIIEEHLQECDECAKMLRQMKELNIEEEKKTQKREINYLKKYKKKISNLKLYLILVIIVAFITAFMGIEIMKSDEVSYDYDSISLSFAATGISTSDGYSFISLDQGVVYGLTEKEEENELSNIEYLAIDSDDEDNLIDGSTYEIQSISISYDEDEMYRASTLYADVETIPPAWGVTYEAHLSSGETEDIDDSTIEKLIEVICKKFGFVYSATSACFEDFQLSVIGDNKYAAVVFYPKIYVVQVLVDDEYIIELSFPRSNDLGSLDGIYAVYETDDIDSMPDIQE